MDWHRRYTKKAMHRGLETSTRRKQMGMWLLFWICIQILFVYMYLNIKELGGFIVIIPIPLVFIIQLLRDLSRE
jgi:hypothetical protein